MKESLDCSQPLVSVIVATKNSAEHLEQCLNSIVNNGYRNIEIIMIDAKSTDQTLEIAQKFEQLRVLNQEGLGLYPAWNQAVASAQGEYIAFLDSDDYWLPGKLECQLNLLLSNPEIDYTITHFMFILEDGCELPTGFRRSLLDSKQIGRIPGTLLTRARSFKLVGEFRADLKIAGDVDWFIRAKDFGLSLQILPDIFMHKRVHEDELTAEAELNTSELLQLLGESISRKKDISK